MKVRDIMDQTLDKADRVENMTVVEQENTVRVDDALYTYERTDGVDIRIKDDMVCIGEQHISEPDGAGIGGGASYESISFGIEALPEVIEFLEHQLEQRS